MQVVIALSAPLTADVAQPLNILTQVKDSANDLASAEARIVELTQEIERLTAETANPVPSPDGLTDPPQAPENPDDTPDSPN